MASEIVCFHRYWNSAYRTPRYPLKNEHEMSIFHIWVIEIYADNVHDLLRDEWVETDPHSYPFPIHMLYPESHIIAYFSGER